jgi:excisionase family DNA binding protein
MKGYLTTSEAAVRLGISSARVRQLILDGVIGRTEKIGATILIPDKEVRRVEEMDRPRGRPSNERNILTERALIARINRRLKPDGQMIKKSRGERAKTELGRYYMVDIYNNTLISFRIDLLNYGKYLGVVNDDERLAY